MNQGLLFVISVVFGIFVVIAFYFAIKHDKKNAPPPVYSIKTDTGIVCHYRRGQCVMCKDELLMCEKS